MHCSQHVAFEVVSNNGRSPHLHNTQEENHYHVTLKSNATRYLYQTSDSDFLIIKNLVLHRSTYRGAATIP